MRKQKNSKSKHQPILKPDLWSNLKSWQQHLILVGILFALPLFLHSPIFLGGEQFATHDIIQWRAGAESLMEHREEFGEQAQWSTNMFSGMPAYVVSNLERFPHFDTIIVPIFSRVFPLVEYWILLGGAYFFLLMMGYRPMVSAVGAILIAFTTYIPIIVGAGHNTKFLAYAYIPWIFAGFKIMISRQDRLLAGFAIFLFAFMMHIRAGHPQVTYYFLFLLGIWWLFEGYDAYKNGTSSRWLQQTALLVGAGLLAVFSVIEQYWSVYDYSQYSIRGGSEVTGTTGLTQNYAFVWSQGWAELLTLSFPNLFGGGELYWGPKPVTSGPHYFGAIGTMLALIGIIIVRKSHLRVFLTVAILAILFSLGKHFSLLNNFMFDYFPLFNKFRTPEMWLILAVFCLTIPAMDGLQYLADKAGHFIEIKHKWFIATGAALGLGLLLLIGSGSFLSYEQPNERANIAEQLANQNQVSPQDPRVSQAVERIMNEQIQPDRKAAARADIIRYIIFVSVTAGLIWVLLSGKLAVSIVLGIILLLTSIDMITVGQRYVPESAYSPDGRSVVEVIESRKRPIDGWLQEAIQTNEPWKYRVFPLSDNAFNNAIPSYFYPSIGGYSGARMNSYDEIQTLLDNSLRSGDLELMQRLLSMLNVRYVTFGGQIPGFNVAFESGGLLALENLTVFPKAWFATDFHQVTSAREAVNALRDNQIDLKNTVIIQHEAGITLSADSLASVEITRYNAHEIDLNVSRSSDGYLVISEMFYEGGWNAFLNGVPVDIHRTNYILRGVEIPAGMHELQFRYEPSWYATARLISNIGNILALLLIIGILGFTVNNRYAKNEEVQK